MSNRLRPVVITKCVANTYADRTRERIIEFDIPSVTGQRHGGLIRFSRLDDGTAVVDLYSLDKGIEVRRQTSGNNRTFQYEHMENAIELTDALARQFPAWYHADTWEAAGGSAAVREYVIECAEAIETERDRMGIEWDEHIDWIVTCEAIADRIAKHGEPGNAGQLVRDTMIDELIRERFSGSNTATTRDGMTWTRPDGTVYTFEGRTAREQLNTAILSLFHSTLDH